MRAVPSIVAVHQDAVADLCRRIGARRLDLFGSAARGNFDEATSDLDFVVELDEMPPVRYADAYFALKEGLETLFGREVDLLTATALANPHFRRHIESERRTIYAR